MSQLTDQAASLRLMAQSRKKTSLRRGRVLAITSGKGGVGKTNTVANLAWWLCKAGQKVLVFDADLGLANMDILLGITPTYNIGDVLAGRCQLRDTLVTGPGGMQIIPAGSGLEELTRLEESKIASLLQQAEELEDFDIMLIDTGAGISGVVTNFLVAADEIVVITTPEPTAFTDAYAMLKLMMVKYGKNDLKLLVNMAQSPADAQQVHMKMSMMLKRFLKCEVPFLGYILHDEALLKCVRKQKLVSEAFPASAASKCYAQVVKTLLGETSPDVSQTQSSNFSSFMKKLIGGRR